MFNVAAALPVEGIISHDAVCTDYKWNSTCTIFLIQNSIWLNFSGSLIFSLWLYCYIAQEKKRTMPQNACLFQYQLMERLRKKILYFVKLWLCISTGICTDRLLLSIITASILDFAHLKQWKLEYKFMLMAIFIGVNYVLVHMLKLVLFVSWYWSKCWHMD